MTVEPAPVSRQPREPGSVRVFTRFETVRMFAGYLFLGVGFGMNAWVPFPLNLFGFPVYCLGMLFVYLHSTRAFRRGLRVGREIDEALEATFGSRFYQMIREADEREQRLRAAAENN